MAKQYYLLILYLLFLRCWNIKPLGYIGPDIWLIALFVYLFLGTFFYKTSDYKFDRRYYIPIGCIFAGIILSMFTVSFFYNQTFTQSIITYRTQYLILTPIFLAKIAPSREDIMSSLVKFSLLYCLFFTLKYLDPSLFVFNNDETVMTLSTIDEAMLDGFSLLTIPLYYYLQKSDNIFSAKQLAYIIFLLTLIFLIQNRSTLFPVVLLTGFMILRMKSRLKYVLISLTAVVLVVYAIDIINDLIEETQKQLADTDYNRNKAFTYFLYKYSPSIWCDIFGNGFLSSHSTSVMAKLQKAGIINSDLGFIGYWSQFGIIPIIAFAYIYIGALVRKNIPIYLRLISIQTLICGLTISYFGSAVHMLFFIVFYYLYNLEFSAERYEYTWDSGSRL